MTIGLGTLRLSPDAFWAMTPREFAAATRGLFGTVQEPISREAMETLSARFPD